MTKILASAIRNKETGVVWSLPIPARHHDLIAICTDWHLGDHSKFEQGFITDQYQYVDRLKARKIAEKANQIIARSPGFTYDGRWLFSEDVWIGQYDHGNNFMSRELFYEYRQI